MIQTYLIEDNARIREHLGAALEDLTPVRVVGHAVDEASALRWLAQPTHAVDLVLIDLFLQQGSGLGVLRATRLQAPRFRRVVVSNYVTDAIRRKCLALGADRVFDKSHDIDALVAYCNALADPATRAVAPDRVVRATR